MLTQFWTSSRNLHKSTEIKYKQRELETLFLKNSVNFLAQQPFFLLSQLYQYSWQILGISDIDFTTFSYASFSNGAYYIIFLTHTYEFY